MTCDYPDSWRLCKVTAADRRNGGWAGDVWAWNYPRLEAVRLRDGLRGPCDLAAIVAGHVAGWLAPVGPAPRSLPIP